MRIGVDAFNLAADRRGMGRIVRQTIAALKQLGQAEIVLIARGRAGALDLAQEFELETLPVGSTRRARFDAVWYPWNGMRFAPRAPSVVTINDPFAFTYPHRNAVARWREQRPIRRAIRSANRVIAISAWGAAELHRLFRLEPDRVTVVPPALDPFWHPVQGGSERAPYVLFLAGPDERKNAGMLFRAFDDAFAYRGAPALLVAGTLNESDERRFAAMHAARERERPSDLRLRELYSGALAVAVPSLAEGYGMPAIEAMACGAPVLAAGAGALPEACDGAAMLLPPQDARAWSQALTRVVGDEPLRAAMRDGGLLRAARIDPLAPATALLACVRRLREDVR